MKTNRTSIPCCLLSLIDLQLKAITLMCAVNAPYHKHKIPVQHTELDEATCISMDSTPPIDALEARSPRGSCISKVVPMVCNSRGVTLWRARPTKHAAAIVGDIDQDFACEHIFELHTYLNAYRLACIKDRPIHCVNMLNTFAFDDG